MSPSFLFLLGLVVAAQAIQIVGDILPKRRQAVEFIVIASDQRSGSSELSEELSVNPCVMDANEIFFLGGQDMLNAHELTGFNDHNARTRPDEYLEAAHKAIQDLYLHELEPVCNGELTLVIKVFPIHGIDMRKFANFLRKPSVLVVVLERQVSERWCSLKHAALSGDWAIHPALHADSAAVKDWKDHCMSALTAGAASDIEELFRDFPQFLRRHSKWYKFLRSTMQGGKAGRMYIEISFAALVAKALGDGHWDIISSIEMAGGLYHHSTSA